MTHIALRLLTAGFPKPMSRRIARDQRRRWSFEKLEAKTMFTAAAALDEAPAVAALVSTAPADTVSADTAPDTALNPVAIGAEALTVFEAQAGPEGIADYVPGSESFVQGLYEDVLGRQPDIDGKFYRSMQLASGATREEVVGYFWNSTEHLSNIVDDLYRSILHRTADAPGRQHWINVLVSGTSQEEVAAAFLSSPEYLAQTPTDRGFIQSLYRDVLGRTADEAGLNTWLIAVPLIGRAEVANHFLFSAERSEQVVDAAYLQYVGGRFTDLEPAPQSREVDQLVQRQTTAAEVHRQILASEEYFIIVNGGFVIRGG